MNVNDVVCVGAEPIVLVDYLAVELGDEDVLREIAVGLKAGAEPAGVEIPGGVGGRAARAGPRAPLAARLRPTRTRAGRPASRRPAGVFGYATVADALLEPTVIYVRAVLELLRSGIEVHGLTHIAGGGLGNLLRLNREVGSRSTSRCPCRLCANSCRRSAT